jgi:hypothetical protein
VRFPAMPQVQSQAIAQAEYDPASHTLFLRFVDGDWYAYLDVPAAAYAALVQAPSKGRFFQGEIRDHYDFRRLDR